MSESRRWRAWPPKFSLGNLLMLTAIIAVGIAAYLAHQKKGSLTQERDVLQAMLKHPHVTSGDKLEAAAMQDVAADFSSWLVYVPKGQDYQLRLGIGTVSQQAIPTVVARLPISAGEHRVTLYTGDSPEKEFRYVVYVDGKQVMEKTMGREWIPRGWSNAHGIGWPHGENGSPPVLQLAAQLYEPKPDIGPSHFYSDAFFDESVPGNGYRLWIDVAGRDYKPTSPFTGFADYPSYFGIGLCDAVRYRSSAFGPLGYWKFTHAQAKCDQSALSIAAEFVQADGTVVSKQLGSFQSWRLCNDALGKAERKWQYDPLQTAYTTFLVAMHKSGSPETGPAVEMKWDVSHPDEVGLRIADSPVNDGLDRWRLHFVGAEHLWRQLQIDQETISADNAAKSGGTKTSGGNYRFDLPATTDEAVRLHWQTNETLPLRSVVQNKKQYTGMQVYQGLPLAYGIEIPPSLSPKLEVKVASSHPVASQTPYPGGPIFDEIQIDLDATQHEWIWIRIELK